MVTDVLVLISFYGTDPIFFYTSCAIFALSYLAYAAYFTLLFRDRPGAKFKDLVPTFLLVLPFAQLVPIFTYIYSLDFKWLRRVMGWFNLHARGFDQLDKQQRDAVDRAMAAKQEMEKQHDPAADPSGLESALEATNLSASPELDAWRLYIDKKLVTQAGFLVEAVVEAIPQSILQLVALLTFLFDERSSENEFDTNLVILSLLISVVTMASKGFFLSYSMDRSTFLFNLMAISFDIVSIFATAAWLFDTRQYGEFQPFFVTRPIPLLASIWFWKIGILSVLSFVVIQSSVLRIAFASARRDRPFGIMVSVVLTLFWGPIVVLMEAFKFSVFPLFVFRSLDGDDSSSMYFYKPLYSWLRSGSDFRRKALVANWVILRSAERRSKLRNEQLRAAAEAKWEALNTESAFAPVKAGGLTHTMLAVIGEDAMGSDVNRSNLARVFLRRPTNAQGKVIGHVLMLRFVFLFYVLGNLYSFFYPILSYVYAVVYTPEVQLFLVQVIFTYLAAAVMLLMLLLAPAAFAFNKCLTAVPPMTGVLPPLGLLQAMKLLYREWVESGVPPPSYRFAGQVVRDALDLGAQLGPAGAVKRTAGDHRASSVRKAPVQRDGSPASQGSRRQSK